jgi:UDP-glucose 4-epimerase
MSVLVTGGAGYIGSVTVELLQKQNESVIVLDNLSRGHRNAIPSDVPFYEGDVGDHDLVLKILREHDVESCIHFAAYAYVGESVSEPAKYFENNVRQGMSLLQAMLEGGVKSFVFSSTCATYGVPERVPISEEARQYPENPYGWTKFFLERVLESYFIAYGLNFVGLRYFNAAGASESRGELHDPEPHLIPNILSAAQGELPFITVYGTDYPTPDGTAVRDYIHVEDLASAHTLALEYLRKGGASTFINIGNGRGFSVLEVIEAARRVTKRPIETSLTSRRPGDPPILVAQAEKARSVLGWHPTYTDIESIIETAWRWKQRHAQEGNSVSFPSGTNSS